MCSKVLTDSPTKLATHEASSVECFRNYNTQESFVKTVLSSPCSSSVKRKLDTLATPVSSKSGLSLLPASLLLQKSFGLIASKDLKENKIRSRPFTVSIEGNIGSGKSTFLNYFSAIPGVITHQEPIDLWTNLKGHNLLGKLYEDPERWSFLFQSYVQLTRLNIHLQQSSSSVKLIERSLQNNRYCFVESGHDCGHLKDAEYSVLCEYYELLESQLDIGIDLIVYLRSTPEIVHSRMLRRGRSEEAGVPLEYLQVVHNYYEKWLLNHEPKEPPAPVLIINADQDLEDIKKEYDLRKPVIMGEKPL
nr:deoxynucleoside kinase-like [Cherax quadricarinatus]XP_053651356.1 deoxynucleoside kinase-like [Cherax quadricarinatus]